jgi:(1->4)-alpha-D-glucan 1-alpha-D-glucosylmutase
MPSLFSHGDYQPVDVSGPRAANVVAFVRSLGDALSLVVVPRICAPLLQGEDSIIMPDAAWQGTTLHMPESIAGQSLRDAFTGRCHADRSQQLPVGDLLRDFPVALLATG